MEPQRDIQGPAVPRDQADEEALDDPVQDVVTALVVMQEA